jgi:catalase
MAFDVWNSASLTTQTAHVLMGLTSDCGVRRSQRRLQGFGVHAPPGFALKKKA